MNKICQTENDVALNEELMTIIERCKDTFSKDGVFPVHLFFMQLEGKTVNIPIPDFLFQNKDSKRLAGTILSYSIKQIEAQGINVDLILFVSEIWISSVNLKDKDAKEKMKQAEKDGVRSLKDKQEGLLFQIETKKGIRSIVYELIKTKDAFVVSPEPMQDMYTLKSEKNVEFYVFQVW